jgi:hypothetical protein
VEPNRDPDPRPSGSGWRWAIGIVLGLITSAFLGYYIWLPSQMGDPASEVVVVTNRTDQPLTIVQVGGDGTRTRIGMVRAHGTLETWLPCGAAQWDALNLQGTLVARRPASDHCRLRWVIG